MSFKQFTRGGNEYLNITMTAIDLALDATGTSRLEFAAFAICALAIVVLLFPGLAVRALKYLTMAFFALTTLAYVAFKVSCLAPVHFTMPTLTFETLASPQNYLFLALLVFRYLRLIVHLISFWRYRPSPVLDNATFSASDVSVVIPTVDPNDSDFLPCLESILMNGPREVCIVTVGDANRELAEEKASQFRTGFPGVDITVSAIKEFNKRKQIASVLPNIRTAITILADDHVFWPTQNFVRSVIAPFEDPKIGAVAPHKRVHRVTTGFGWASYWNFLGCIYLLRHNFELRATNAMDGGLFVISGRTAAFRTHILQDPEFLYGFTNERLFFGLFSLPNADDDNFITRWLVRKGWQLKFQQCRNSTMETTLGTYPKFLSQALRWTRTTVRSNSASLLTDRTVWKAQPWCVYAVYLTSFVNFALFYDAALFYTLSKTTFFDKQALVAMVIWVLGSKLFKLVPHFYRHPADLIYLPGYYIFAYAHSLIKLWAMLTFWNTHWGGRTLEPVEEVDFVQNSFGLAYDEASTSESVSEPESLPGGHATQVPRPSAFSDAVGLEEWWANNLALAAEEERAEEERSGNLNGNGRPRHRRHAAKPSAALIRLVEQEYLARSVAAPPADPRDVPYARRQFT